MSPARRSRVAKAGQATTELVHLWRATSVTDFCERIFEFER